MYFLHSNVTRFQSMSNQTLGITPNGLTRLASKGPPTIHQRALLCFWIASLVLYVTRLFSRLFRHSSTLFGSTEITKIALLENGEPTPSKEEKSLNNQKTKPETQPKPNQNTATSISFEEFLKNVVVLGAIMSYFYICDYAHYLPAAPRVYSRDVFFFLCLALVLISGFFTTRDCSAKLLNREQTEEWKGLMQVLFVWYHYFKAVETYNAIRVFIAAYVWMTGFGNFSFFWIRQDFSLYRILKMLFRLNFLVLVTCLVTANQYMLYYICAMHTFWFLSVYAVMRPLYTRNTEPKIMAIKFALYAGIVFTLFEFPAVGKIAFKPFISILNYNNSLHEWMFRAGLDHYATLLGMICAYFHPNVEAYFTHLESEKQDKGAKLLSIATKLAMACLCVIALVFWVKHVFVLQKYDYNQLHPYFSFIPLLTYILLRNLFPFLRVRFMFLFTWLGKITLETYISQLHIYMQGNAKYLIVYLPGYPLLNFSIATAIYIFMSYHLFHVTGNLSAYLITKDFKVMGRKSVIGLFWIGGCYLSGMVFCNPKLVSLL